MRIKRDGDTEKILTCCDKKSRTLFAAAAVAVSRARFFGICRVMMGNLFGGHKQKKTC